MILVAGALGIGAFLLFKAMHKMSPRDLIIAPLIPFVLPLIALGITLSSRILAGIQPITLMQAFSVALVGLALGLGTIGIAIALKFMKHITWKEMLILPLMIPLVVGGIVAASLIFQAFAPIKNPLQLLVGSAIIGLALIATSITVALLGRLLKGKMDFLLVGVLGAIAVAGAIVAIAWIFQLLPNDFVTPPIMWTLKTGLSLLIFSGIAVLVALIMSMNFSFEMGGAAGSCSIGIGGSLAAPALPHHRAYGSVPRRFGWLNVRIRWVK